MTRRPSADIIKDMQSEYRLAANKFGPFTTYHHGYAVLLEEMDELWEEIKKKKPNKHRLRSEATQVGAMVIRFIHDLLDEDVAGS